jgi:hypothetical protein
MTVSAANENRGRVKKKHRKICKKSSTDFYKLKSQTSKNKSSIR